MASEENTKKAHATSAEDYYALLEISAGASESEIRRAYRQTARKYHPDKVGATNETARERFHLLQIAYDVLADDELRRIYDNARRAREEKKARESAYDDRRRQMIAELEQREQAASVAKRKREAGYEDPREQELRRLAEDGRRRTRELEAKLRREAREREQAESIRTAGLQEAHAAPSGGQGVDEEDRAILVRFPAGSHDSDELKAKFSRFGKVDLVLLRNKKRKVESNKQEYTTAMVVFESIVGAHAAIIDVPGLAKSDAVWSIFEGVRWAGGKEPDCLPKPQNTQAPNVAAKNTPTSHEVRMMRLKNIQRKRDAEKQRKAGIPDPAKDDLDGETNRAPSYPAFKAKKDEEKWREEERERLIEELRKEDAEAEAAEAGVARTD